MQPDLAATAALELRGAEPLAAKLSTTGEPSQTVWPRGGTVMLGAIITPRVAEVLMVAPQALAIITS